MTEDCTTCKAIPTASRWRKFAAWTGLIFFCPCHLPLTIAGLILIISASGIPIGDSWGRPLLYAIFGGAFVFFLLIVLRMVSRRRALERDRDAEHARHQAGIPGPPPVARNA